MIYDTFIVMYLLNSREFPIIILLIEINQQN